MPYIYRHIRLDKNVPFYIGIGGDDDGEYRRAYNKNSRERNKYWNNIVSKTEYQVDILMDAISWAQACEKEKEFISIYRRKKDGGTLANLTLGGDGKFGYKTTEETLAKLRGMIPHNKGVKMTPELIEKNRLGHLGQPAYNKGLPWSEESKKKMSDAKKGNIPWMLGKKHTEESKEKMSLTLKGRVPWNKGNRTPRKYPPKKGKSRKGVLQFNKTGELIAEHYSLSIAALAVGASRSHIAYCCNRKGKIINGFIWEYKNKELVKDKPLVN